ncbi:hypothetical protein PPYR_07887 [Photinus pyralis]|uniref:Lipase domain-containing protein n=1 Tax=Photinus pyralis TaxID=7054 RepID=A0A1Y1KBH7_PHOPY|nr:phospholipase A1-like [Photinus pyralis]KAB0800007.1 hypothetical protein PPYR_07887 [Photinus pyralis]
MTPILLVLCLIFQCGSAFMDIPVRDLPDAIRDEFVKIFMQTLNFFHTCNSSDTQEVQYLLYNGKHLKQPVVLDPKAPAEVDQEKPTVFIIHGWLSSPNSSSFPMIRDAYLTKHDYNVIMVDWAKTTQTAYTHAYCALPIIAKQVAQLLCLLDANYNIPLEMIHLVGHSLGGQMSGLIGQNTKEFCQKPVDRITALDPAGPLFLGLPESNRLDSSDANFVQVIHTNGGVFGYLLSCGDVDFFVNCGLFQPGCISIDIKKLLDSLVSDVTCSHSRSQQYMAESIYADNFVGYSCKLCPVACVSEVHKPKTTMMGEYSPRNAKDRYLVTTASSPPFAQKCNSYTYGICL